MKRKKSRLLIIISVTLVLLGLGAFGAAELLLKLRADRWYRQGVAAAKAGDNEKAAGLLARYLHRNPNKEDALIYYIHSRELAPLPNGQHIADTITALKMLLQLDSERQDDRRHLMDLYARIGRSPEAIDTANALLEREQTLKQPADPHVLQVKTEMLRRMHQDREALATADLWIKAAPLNLQALMAHMSLRVQLARDLNEPPTRIVGEAQALREAHPGDPRFEVLQAFAYAKVAAGQTSLEWQSAKDWLHTAASHVKPTDDCVGLLIDQFDAMGLSQESLSLLRTLVSKGAGPELRHRYACRCWELGDWSKTVDALADIDAKSPDSDPTLIAFDDIALSNLSRAADAKSVRAALDARKDPSAQAWSLLLKRTLDNASVDDREVVKACRLALALEPQNAYLSYFLGDADSRLGENELAVESWRRAMLENTTWNLPPARLVEALLRKGRPDQAVEIATFANRRNPNSAAIAIALAQAYQADLAHGAPGHAEELLKFVDQIQKAFPGEDRTQLVRVQLLASEGKKTDATAAATAALESKPPLSEHSLLALSAASRSAELGLEDRCFQRSQELYGMTPELAYARAADAFSTGKGPAGLQLFDQLAKQNSKPSDEVLWRLCRAQYLDVIGDPAARSAWVALGDAYPNDLRVQQTILAARSVAGDWEFLGRTIDRTKALAGPDALSWRLAKARLCVESARNDADYETGAVDLNKIIQADPSLPEPHVLLAHALVHMKRIDGAIEHLTIASQLDRTSVPIALQLAALLQSRGDFERVREQLEKITPMLRSPAQRHAAAAMLAQQGNQDSAIKLLQPESSQKGDAQDDLLLATLYFKRREFDKAESVLNGLLAKPDLQTIQFAARFYIARGRIADAAHVMARIDDLKLPPGLKEMAWGLYQTQLGDRNQAIEHYRAATREAPGNPAAWRLLAASQFELNRVSDAVESIRNGAQADPDNKDLSSLKGILDLLRDADAIPELRPLVAAVARDPQTNATAIELLQILVQSSRSVDRDRLASQLQQLVERHPEFGPAHLQLAYCYWEMGRRNQAIETVRRAMNLLPMNSDLAHATTKFCAAEGHWQDMLDAAQTWKNRAPDEEVLADQSIAAAQIRLGRSDAAVAQLQPYLDWARSDPDRYADVLATYCIAAANAGHPQEIESLIWPLTSKSPTWRARCAEVACELNDAAEGKRLMARVEAITPSDAFSEQFALGQAYERLADRLNDAELRQKATQITARAVAAPKASAVALAAAGAQAERSEDFETARQYYRRAIQMDGTLFVAKNNLAMLIVRSHGDLAEAKQLATDAVRLQPGIASIHDTLAYVDASAGDKQGAAQAERDAVKLEPTEPTWQIRLAQYLLDGGDVAKAQEIVQSLNSGGQSEQALKPQQRQQLDSIRKRLKAPAFTSS